MNWRVTRAAGDELTLARLVNGAWTEQPGPLTFRENGAGVPLTAIPGLPGYLDLTSLSPFDASAPDKGSMFLQLPLMFGRDHDDAIPLAGNRMRAAAFVWLDSDAVAPLGSGTTTVKVGADGYAQWREVPAAATLSIRGAGAWKLYNAEFAPLAAGNGAKTGLRAPKGSLLVVFDAPNQTVTITR